MFEEGTEEDDIAAGAGLLKGLNFLFYSLSL
jgi:hypothetical protein